MTRSRIPGQPSLFGDEPPRPLRSVVGAASVSETLRDVARALPPSVRLGTSSWSFPGWRGLVYDQEAVGKAQLARHGLAAYARHPLLHTVGVDRTYYAPLGADVFRSYAEAVPDDFRFLVKACGEVTTPTWRAEPGARDEPNPRFLDASWAAGEVVGPFVEGLGSKAGPLVFQFPPQGHAVTRDPHGFAEALGSFLAELPRGPLYAVELRDRRLFGPAYVEALAAGGATHCLNVHPRMPSVEEQRRVASARAGPLVVRWMLHGGLRYEEARQRYEPFDRLVDEDETSRRALARAAFDHAALGLEVFVVANNKAEGSAPLTVFRLAEAIAALDPRSNP